MGRKIEVITIVMYTLSLIGCSRATENPKGQVANHHYDTIYYANKEVKSIQVQDKVEIENGFLIPVKKGGQSIWIDKVYYQSVYKNNLIIAFADPMGEKMLFYSNRDTSIIEKIAINDPLIKVYKLKSSEVLSITDSSFNSGYLIKSLLFYQVSTDGKLSNKREFFTQKKNNESNYDTLIMPKIIDESLVIFKNNKADFTYH